VLGRIARLAPPAHHACCVLDLVVFGAVVMGDEGVGRCFGGVVWCVWCGVCGVGLRSRGEG